MTTTTISRTALRQFSAFSAAFGHDQTPFAPFIQRPFHSLADLTAQAQLKQTTYSPQHRSELVRVLEEQHGDTISASQRRNLDLLAADTTFTITTGHQLTLFGGPLFLLYKVLQAVKLAEQFNTSQETFRAVPVFWLASEDHDVDEIRSAPLFGKTLTWETTQRGPVGRFSLDDYSDVFAELKSFFTTKPDSEIRDLLDNLPTENYGEHFRAFASRLFSAFGVLVLQPDERALKQLFVPVLREEIETQASYPAVQATNAALEKAGLSPQAQARACNLFLLNSAGRHRIDPSANGFAIDGTTYTKEQLLQLVDERPEQFSPNVILRPVYQETVLPNLVYIGGGAEMAYWIQLKGVFDRYNVTYPLLQQRNSLLLIDGGTQKRIEKLGWELERFFLPKDQLHKDYLLENDAEQLDLTAIEAQFQELRLALIAKAKEVDVSLESFAEAETVRMSKQIEAIGQRLLKQVKQQHEQALKSIDAVSDRFLPGAILQERHFHWLNFAPSGDYSPLLQQVYEAIDPFESGLIVLTLD